MVLDDKSRWWESGMFGGVRKGGGFGSEMMGRAKCHELGLHLLQERENVMPGDDAHRNLLGNPYIEFQILKSSASPARDPEKYFHITRQVIFNSRLVNEMKMIAMVKTNRVFLSL
jgi:hypothetical protein